MIAVALLVAPGASVGPLPLVQGAPEVVTLISVPLFTALIGGVTNWTGVWMIFNPLKFAGFRVPGLATLVTLAPRKIQQVPGLMNGGIGWQGIIPSRAGKMGSVAVDKGLAKLGSTSEFFDKLDPNQMAEHVVRSSGGEISEMVDRIIQRENPVLWRSMPGWMKAAVHARVRQQLPGLVRDVTQALGENIEHLLDVKLMVVRHLERNPELANKVFRNVGERELRFLVYFGFAFGGLMGIPLIFLLQAVPEWWVLPIAGAVLGYVTNWLALSMIFEPVNERRIGPLRMQGLFLKRQPEVAKVYAQIIAEDIVTMRNVAWELLNGSRSARTRRTIESVLRPAVDEAMGPVRGAVRVAVGSSELESIRSGLATEAVEETVGPLGDAEFNRRQSVAIRDLIEERMLEMSSEDTSELLRSAIKEDEWLLILHGAVLGIAAGLVHLSIFGTGV